jgi:hypothetical protein
MKLPNGLIVQWLTGGAIPAGGSQSISFPIAFPNACLSAVATHIRSSATSTPTGLGINPTLSTTAVTLYNEGTASPTLAVFMIAIGW